MNTVLLSELVDSIEMQDNETQQYLHRKTGKIVMIFDGEVLVSGGDTEDNPEWKKENIRKLKRKFNTEEYVELPTKYDIHEYKTMEDFCSSIEDEKLKNIFFNTIRGIGAFRRFKDIAYRHDLLDKWYEFKTEAIKEKAIEWCQENNIKFTE